MGMSLIGLFENRLAWAGAGGVVGWCADGCGHFRLEHELCFEAVRLHGRQAQLNESGGFGQLRAASHPILSGQGLPCPIRARRERRRTAEDFYHRTQREFQNRPI